MKVCLLDLVQNYLILLNTLGGWLSPLKTYFFKEVSMKFRSYFQKVSLVLQLKMAIKKLLQRIQGNVHHHTLAMEAIEEEEPEEDDLIRDEFNLHKIIVVATSPGKIYGIRSHTGKIAWQQFLPDMKPFRRDGDDKLVLVVQRSRAHPPHQPLCSVIGASQHTGNGLLASFNPITGLMFKG